MAGMFGRRPVDDSAMSLKLQDLIEIQDFFRRSPEQNSLQRIFSFTAENIAPKIIREKSQKCPAKFLTGQKCPALFNRVRFCPARVSQIKNKTANVPTSCRHGTLIQICVSSSVVLLLCPSSCFLLLLRFASHIFHIQIEFVTNHFVLFVNHSQTI